MSKETAGSGPSSSPSSSRGIRFPPVGSDLHELYQSLPDVLRRVFRKVWMAVWLKVVNVRNYHYASSLYAVRLVLPHLSPRLTLEQFQMLTLVWHLSEEGKRCVDSRIIRWMGYVQYDYLLRPSQHGGLIRRSYYDTNHPYLKSSRSHTYHYLVVEKSCVRYFRRFDHLYNIVVREVNLRSYQWDGIDEADKSYPSPTPLLRRIDTSL